MSTRAARWLLPVIYLGFVSLGLPDGTLGVAWPQLHGSLQLPLGLAGPMLLVVTLLSAGSSFMSGAVLRRVPIGPVVMVSCLLTGGALLLVSRSTNLGWLALAAVPLGLGAGTVDAGLNGYVARHYSARHMSWLHACWGVGATVGPLIMAEAVTQSEGWRAGYTTIGTVQLTLVVVFAATLGWWRAVPPRGAGRESEDTGKVGTARPGLGANSTAGWLSAAIFAVYVGIEMSTGLWLATHLVVERGMAVSRAGLAVSLYFGSITGGRILVGFLVEWLGNRRVVAAGTWLATAGAVGVCLAEAPGALLAAVMALGLGFAPVYPGLMHEVPQRFASDAVRVVIGRQSGAAYLGAAALPASAGWLVQTSGPWAVMIVVAAGAGLLALMVRTLDRLS